MTNETLKNYIKKEIVKYYEDGKQYLDSFYNSVDNVFKRLNDSNLELVLFDKEHFIKSNDSLVDSLSRRICSFAGDISKESTDTKTFSIAFNTALGDFKDFFRINVRINDDSFFEISVINVLKAFRNTESISHHYDNIDKNYKNSFKQSSDCKDFKVYFKYKEKYSFEIQFHNVSSEKMNLATHGIYEVYRAQDLRTDYKEKLGKDRKALYEMVVPPQFDEMIIKKEGLES